MTEYIRTPWGIIESEDDSIDISQEADDYQAHLRACREARLKAAEITFPKVSRCDV